MQNEGPARKLVVTVDESARWHGRSTHLALLELLRHRGLSQATACRAIAGFSGGGAIRTDTQMDGAMPLPVRIEAVDTAAAIEAVLPDVYDMVERGLVEVEDVRAARLAPEEGGGAPAHRAAPAGEEREDLVRLVGKAKMLRIHIGEDDRWEGEPLYQTIVKRARQLDIAGATVYRGILGYGAHKRIHRHHALALSSDDPVMITVIDEEAKINAFLAALDHVVTEGCLIAISDVTVVKYVGHGTKDRPR